MNEIEIINNEFLSFDTIIRDVNSKFDNLTLVMADGLSIAIEIGHLLMNVQSGMSRTEFREWVGETNDDGRCIFSYRIALVLLNCAEKYDTRSTFQDWKKIKSALRILTRSARESRQEEENLPPAENIPPWLICGDFLHSWRKADQAEREGVLPGFPITVENPERRPAAPPRGARAWQHARL